MAIFGLYLIVLAAGMMVGAVSGWVLAFAAAEAELQAGGLRLGRRRYYVAAVELNPGDGTEPVAGHQYATERKESIMSAGEDKVEALKRESVEAGDAREPECPFKVPVRAEDGWLIGADGIPIHFVGKGERHQWAEYLAWVINSHINVAGLQMRMERLAFQRATPEIPGTIEECCDALEARLTAQCVAHEHRAIVIVRRDEGFAYRRSIDHLGTREVPEDISDALMGYRFRRGESLTDDELRQLDEAVSVYESMDARLAVLPGDSDLHAIRIDGVEQTETVQA